MNWQQTITLSLIVFFIQPVKTRAIGPPVSDSSLPVIRTVAAYQKTIKNTAGKQLINLQTYIPGIITELRYAEANNFMQQQLYPTNAIALLRLDAAIALKKVQLELNQAQLGIKIWDAYRPYSITVKMWNLIKDERFVADPRKGSGHNRGIAVDLTLINLSDGQEIFMGTRF
ncbi:MAG: M15 family metallopeptidase [Ferruginibacter sp.]